MSFAPALLAVSAIASAGSAAYSFMQQRASASYQERVANENAAFQQKLTAANVAREKLAALASERALQNQNRRRMATLTNAIAASGAGMSGSPLEIVADSAKQARLGLEYLKLNNSQRIEDVRLSGQSQERRYLFEAQGAAFERNSAFGTLLGGFGQSAGIGAQAYSSYQQGLKA